MNTLLKLQLKKVYGKDFNLDIQDDKFKDFLKLVKEAYEDYEEEEKFSESILAISAKELEETDSLLVKKHRGYSCTLFSYYHILY